MDRMGPASVAEFLELQTFGSGFLVLCRRVVPALALRAFQRNDVSHGVPVRRKPCVRMDTGRKSGPNFYSMISEIVPAPTVWPPSRIANRNPFSIAIGVISRIDRFTLSPGITISVPSGNSATPVTSVVRK